MPLPKFEHHDARHKPTLIEPARSQMTASSPRGTFSQAELTAERVTTRCITRRARCRSPRIPAASQLSGCAVARRSWRLPGQYAHGRRAMGLESAPT